MKSSSNFEKITKTNIKNFSEEASRRNYGRTLSKKREANIMRFIKSHKMTIKSEDN